MAVQLHNYIVHRPIPFGGLSVFPISLPPAAQAREYEPLPPALESGDAIVAEAESAAVPELRLDLRTGGRFVALTGTLLRGGRQHRAVRGTQVFAGPIECAIDVRCVEAKRWGANTGVFRAEATAPLSVRAALTGGDQSGVWDEVSAHLSKTRTLSVTESLLDSQVFTKPRSIREPAFPGPSTVGYVALDGVEPVALELVCNATVAKWYWPRWMRGLPADGMPSEAGPRAKARVDTLLEQVLRSVKPGAPRLDAAGLEGTVAIDRDTLVHVVAWVAREPTDPMAARSARSRARGGGGAGLPQSRRVEPRRHGRAMVLVTAGPDMLKVRELKRGDTLTVGRGDDQDFRMTHTTLSRRHGRLGIAHDGTPWFMDLGSTNGSYRGDELLIPNRPRALQVGEPIALAGGGSLCIVEAGDGEIDRLHRAYLRDGLLGDRAWSDQDIDQQLGDSRDESLSRVGLLGVERLDLLRRWRGDDVVAQVLRVVRRRALECFDIPEHVWWANGEELVLLLPSGNRSAERKLRALARHIEDYPWGELAGRSINVRTRFVHAPFGADVQGTTSRLRGEFKRVGS